MKEFQLCDFRRLRKKPQDAQDDVTELFDLFDAHFWELERYTEFGLQKRSSSVQQVGVYVILRVFCGFMARSMAPVFSLACF